MVELNKIPHINEISNHGAFAGAGQKKTATFRERYHQQNKVVPSLEEAIRRKEAEMEAAASDYERYGALYAEKEAMDEELLALMERWERLSEEAGE